MHKCVTTRKDERDYIKGDGNIPFRAISDGNWTPRIEFFELQKIDGFETDGCILFTANESLDAQMDNLIQTGEVNADLLNLFNQLGYMDTGLDGKPHFHSSPRFTQILTNNGYNGNALQDPWIVFQNQGVIPWTDFPFDSTITQEEYLTGITQAMLDKGFQFLAAIGGKTSIQYHWVVPPGSPFSIINMIDALPQAPLCLATPADAPGWNETMPPIPDNSNPNHSTMNYMIDANNDCWVYDHYIPAKKELVPGYPIPQAMQGVVSINPPPPPPVLPANPTVSQEQNWLTSLIVWLNAILDSIKGRKS